MRPVGGLVASLDRVVEADQRVVDEGRRLRDPVEVDRAAAGHGVEGEVDLARADDHRAARAEAVGVGDRERDPVAGVAAEVMARASGSRSCRRVTPWTGVPGWTWPSWRKSMFQVKALSGRSPSSGSVPSPEYEITSPARKWRLFVGVRIVAVGTLPALIVIGVEIESWTPSETVSRACTAPAWRTCAIGLAAVDVVAVAEVPGVGERLALRVGRVGAGESRRGAASAPTSGSPTRARPAPGWSSCS